MRRNRLLTSSHAGSAVLESIFAMIFVLLLTLGVVQTALVLYARNILISSAHEGARAAVELGVDPADAAEVARGRIERAAGRLVNDLDVAIAVVGTPEREALSVHVTADLAAIGPLPIEVPVDTTATAYLEQRP